MGLGAHAGNQDHIPLTSFIDRPANRFLAIQDDLYFVQFGETSANFQARPMRAELAWAALGDCCQVGHGTDHSANRWQFGCSQSLLAPNTQISRPVAARRAARKQLRSASGESAPSTSTANGCPPITRSIRPGNRSTDSNPRAIVVSSMPYAKAIVAAAKQLYM